jgi:lauroyl/myristoyl acyltransferase
VGKLSTYVFGKGVETTEPILMHAFPEWSEKERREFIRKTRDDIDNPEFHAYTEWYQTPRLFQLLFFINILLF